MEELGPYPTVDEVLNKLKSNGTFDQFRKACLASVEAEVRGLFDCNLVCLNSPFVMGDTFAAFFQGLWRAHRGGLQEVSSELQMERQHN